MLTFVYKVSAKCASVNQWSVQVLCRIMLIRNGRKEIFILEIITRNKKSSLSIQCFSEADKVDRRLGCIFSTVSSVWQLYMLKSLQWFNPLPNKLCFLRVCSTSLLKTLREKEKLLVTSNFSFSHSILYPLEELSFIFIRSEIVVCKLFQFGRV